MDYKQDHDLHKLHIVHDFFEACDLYNILYNLISSVIILDICFCLHILIGPFICICYVKKVKKTKKIFVNVM